MGQTVFMDIKIPRKRSNRQLSRLPTNTYLLCLAGMSSLFLCTLFVFWLEEMSYLYFDVNQFFAHVCDFSSVWLIVLVGCERLVLLHRRRRSLTVEKACAQVIALVAIAMLFNSWILYVASIQHGVCDIDPSFDRIYHVMTVLEFVYTVPHEVLGGSLFAGPDAFRLHVVFGGLNVVPRTWGYNMAEQVGRAFLKQQTINLNSKARILVGKKKVPRYTPHEASQGTYIDKKCPWTGNCAIRGNILTGVVLKNKMTRTIVVRRDYLHSVKKYRRFEKRHRNVPAHCSPAFRDIAPRDVVTIGECRPLSKTVRFNVLKFSKAGSRRKEDLPSSKWTVICMLVPSVIIFSSNVFVIYKLNAHISVSLGRLSSHFSLDLEKPKKKSKRGWFCGHKYSIICVLVDNNKFSIVKDCKEKDSVGQTVFRMRRKFYFLKLSNFRDTMNR
ncbi:unnamed protein product [Heligmosomoides polygyrus]|uniref:Small ribosomal subunit protein uS17 n=1 Tax=Heligmosomoides polygyrus TaxID=6339 RepID=A0A3P7XRT9_HELPZ|nr:unnamed protein product [Heligmosomoides polygyrus]